MTTHAIAAAKTRKVLPSKISLMFLMCLASIGGVIIAPALPALSHFFHINTATATLVISLYLLGYSVGQLIYGPLGHAFGSRQSIFIGIGLTIISVALSLLSAHWHLWSLFLIFRFCMGLAAGVGLKMAFHIVTETYPQQQVPKTMAFLIAGMAIMPGLANTVGGFSVEHFNWQTALIIFAVYALVLSLPIKFMPLKNDAVGKSALHPKTITHKYLQTLKDKQLVICGLMFGFASALLYIFVACAPVIVINHMHYSPGFYGVAALIPYLAMLMGSIVYPRLEKCLSRKKLINAHMGLIIISVITLSTFILLHQLSLYALFIPMLFIIFSMQVLIIMSTSSATVKSKDKSHATAMMSFLGTITVVATIFTLGLFQHITPILMMSAYIIVTVIMIALVVMLNKLK